MKYIIFVLIYSIFIKTHEISPKEPRFYWGCVSLFLVGVLGDVLIDYIKRER